MNNPDNTLAEDLARVNAFYGASGTGGAGGFSAEKPVRDIVREQHIQPTKWVNTPDTEKREENEHGNTPKEQFVSDYDEHEDKENDMNLTGKDMQKLYALLGEFEDKIISSRDTYWKERVQKEVDELWHDLGKYQGWLGGVMGNETDFTLMQQQPTKEVREAKALHTAIIMKAKEKVHQTQMKVKSLLDNLK